MSRAQVLEQLQRHQVTLRKAAVLLGLEYHDMMYLSSQIGVDIGYSIEDVCKDLDRI